MAVIRYRQTLALIFSSRHHTGYESWVSDTVQYAVSHIRRIYRSGNDPLSLTVKIIPIILLLSGCITTGTPIPIKIPVPIPCVTADQLPAQPKASTDADLAKLDDGDLVLTLAADRIEYRRHSNEASALLIACTK